MIFFETITSAVRPKCPEAFLIVNSVTQAPTGPVARHTRVLTRRGLPTRQVLLKLKNPRCDTYPGLNTCKLLNLVPKLPFTGALTVLLPFGLDSTAYLIMTSFLANITSSMQRTRELVAVLCYLCSSLLSRRLSNAVRRWFIRDIIRYSRNAYPPTPTKTVLQIPGNAMLKIGGAHIAREEESMRFVSRYTSVPVPRVLDAWLESEDKGFLVMERLPGQTLLRTWRDLTSPQRAHIASQLKDCTDQLRRLTPLQPEAVSSLHGGAFKEDRLEYDDIGPFATEGEYHDWRVSLASTMSAGQPETLERIHAIRAALRDDHGIVFTHGDLNPSNILVSIAGEDPEAARVTGVIDWEMSGWRPAYWEYVKCMHGMGGKEEWKKFVEAIVPAYSEEHRLDDELQRITGEPL